MTKLFDPAGAAHMTGGGEPQSVSAATDGCMSRFRSCP
jgi:hypothetical protein